MHSIKSIFLGSLVFVALCLAGGRALCAEQPANRVKPIVRFGVNLRFNPITVYERYQPMMDYLTQNTPYKFELKISRDYRETIKFLGEGKIDICSIGDGGLMKALLLNSAVPVVKPLNAEGRPYYRSNFMVRADSPIKSLQDLKGKKVALGYKHSTSGNMVPRCTLAEHGLRLEDLGSLTNLKHHSEVARAVLKGEFDAGVVKDAVASRYVKKGLRVLASSRELPATPLVVRRGTSQQLIDAITTALVRLDRNNPQHQKLMKSWDLEYQNGFVPAKAADYQNLLAQFKKVPYGCGAGCHK